MKRSRKLILFAPVLLFILYTLCQTSGFSNNQLLTQYNRADLFYQKATSLSHSANYSEEEEAALNRDALAAFELFLKNLPPGRGSFDSLKYQAAFKYGELQHYFGHLSEALGGYRLAIETVKESLLHDSLLFKPYLYSGILYYGKNNFDSAAIYFHDAEKVLKKNNHILSDKERLYNTFGVLYYERGDYRQAKNYFLKALETLSRAHPYYRELHTNYEVNLAQIYFKLEDYDKANNIYQDLLKKKINTDEINQNLGLINLYLGAASRSLQYFRKVNYKSNKIIWLYANMGESFFNLLEYDSAEYYLNKAIAESETYGSNTDHYALGTVFYNYGNLKLALHQAEEALMFYQKAINNFYPGFKTTSVSSDPNEFSGVFSYVNLFNALTQKAAAWHELYQERKEISYARQELQAFQSAFTLADYVAQTYESDEARLFLNKIKYIVHSRPIDIAYELYLHTKNKNYLEALYQLDQQNKASVLSVRLHAVGVLSDSSSQSRESQVKAEISRLSIKASLATDSVQLSELNKKIRDQEIALGQLRDSLEGRDQLLTRIPAITELQQNLLDRGAGLISFHLSERMITRIRVTEKEFYVDQQNLPPDFYETLTAYLDGLKNPAQQPSATRFFDLFFKDIKFGELEQLIIIPDDELNYLPFETLQDSAGNYLVEKCSVQYQYATTLLKKGKPRLSGYETLALAPFAGLSYSDSSIDLQPLPHSLQEVRSLRGKHLIDSNATKRNFLDELQNYRVLHLATHAVVDNRKDQLSFISFAPAPSKENFLLYAEEVYNLPLRKTELVILSACETGAGSLVRGEGIMSLSRAFAYAGCNNIITSLWVANDFSTAWLTGRLHFYLDKKYTIDKALQQAKLDYLADKNISPRLKHPCYWSHLVFIGNYEAVKDNPNYWLIIVTILATVGLLVLLRYFRRKRP